VTITCEDLYGKWVEQEGRCRYTGWRLKLMDDASVDRIDSTHGYVLGNIQWVHKDVNKAKMALREDDFISLCCAVAYMKEIE
jgi:hypothetical protein